MRGPAWKGFMPETASNRVESRNERRKRKYLQNINYLCNNASQKNSYRFFFGGGLLFDSFFSRFELHFASYTQKIPDQSRLMVAGCPNIT
jgi:hypothetical protein